MEDPIDFDEEVDQEEISKQNKIKTAKMKKIQEELDLQNKLKSGAQSMMDLYKDPQAKKEVQTQIDSFNSKISSLQKLYEGYSKTDFSSKKESKTKLASESEFSLRKSTSVSTLNDKSNKYRLNHYRSGTPIIQKKIGLGIIKGITKNLNEVLGSLEDYIARQDSSNSSKLDLLINLTKTIKTSGNIEPYNVFNRILKIILKLLCHNISEIRAACFKVLRHVIIDVPSIKSFWKIQLDIFLIRALTKDNKQDTEKEQALKLVRSLVDWSTLINIPKGVIMSVVAIADSADDKFKTIALETLCEILMRNPSSASSALAIRPIFNSLLNGPVVMVDIAVCSILNVVDNPKSRIHICPRSDLPAIISNCTDTYGEGQVREDHLKYGSLALYSVFSSWTGLLSMCMNQRYKIKCLVETLTLPVMDLQKMLMETILLIFRIELPSGLPDLLTSRINIDLNFKFKQSLMSCIDEKKRFINHHLALVLAIFIDEGLLEALVSIIRSCSRVTSMATILVGIIIELSNRLLPGYYNAKVQSLAQLFGLSLSFDNEIERHRATLALAHIDKLHRIAEQEFDIQLYSKQTDDLKVTNNPSQKKVEIIKENLGINIDDVNYRNLLAETQVLVFKGSSWEKWNWDSIEQILNGPLLNSKRVEEALSSKFYKRLLAFYKPSKKRFRLIKLAKANMKYVKIGQYLIRSLLTCPASIKFLGDSSVLSEVCESLMSLNISAGMDRTEDVVFSKEKLETTLTCEYFNIICILTRCKEGIELFEKAKIFSMFYKLSDFRIHYELVKIIIESMDYEIDGHPRIILSKILTSGYKNIRLHATGFLGKLLKLKPPKFNEWVIRLVITQLYDPALDVAQRAVLVLDDACSQPAYLESFIKLRPILDHLGEMGNALMIRLLSTSKGLEFLKEMGYFSKEMQYWHLEGNIRYVIQVELHISKALNDLRSNSNKKGKDEFVDDGSDVPHFYGVLCDTDEGCYELETSGHMQEFSRVIEQNLENLEDILFLKASLWAIGNIGASKRGIKFLEYDGDAIIKNIIKLSENCSIPSIKGTCYYVLGLISRNEVGACILEEFNWKSVGKGSYHKNPGMCLPVEKQRDSFLNLPLWEVQRGTEKVNSLYFQSEDPLETEILTQISNICNNILASNASKTLTKLKYENPRYFCDLEVYKKVMMLTSTYHYRLPARKFIQELFNGVVIKPEDVEKSFNIDKMCNEFVKGIEKCDSFAVDDFKVGLIVKTPNDFIPLRRIEGFEISA